MRRTRTSLIAAGLAGVIALAAVPAALASRHATPRVAATCSRSQLGVRANGQMGAAGTIYGAWVFTNVSTTACTLNGYPDLQLYGRTGRPIRTVVKRNLPPRPSSVTLTPGGSATFFSSYSDVASGPTPCAMSEVVQITAPNVSAPLFIPAELAPCRGIVNVSAVRAGVHHA